MGTPAVDGGGFIADRLLADITSVLVSEGAPEQVLAAVADSLRELVPYDALTIHRVAPPRRLVPALVRVQSPEGSKEGPHVEDGPIPLGTGILGTVAETGVAELIVNKVDDPRARPSEGRPEAEAQAAIVVPLVARDERTGVLALYRAGTDAGFENAELTLATRFAAIAALAIDNAVIRARLADEVITDHLTGLHNHRYFHERLGEEMRRVHRTHLPLGLLIADIDDFKRTNDRFGHLEGDRVLQTIGSVFREVIREEDVVSRIGGEEFAILLPITSSDDAMGVAERIRAAMQTRVFVEDEAVTVSVGVAGAPGDGASPRELFAAADAALRRAKKDGKNRVRRFMPGPDSEQPTGVPRPGLGDAARAIAQLKAVHALIRRLHRITDVEQLAAAITSELRSLIDYHNCRVSLLGDDGASVVPIAFRGDASAYAGEPSQILRVPLGVGITGRVVATGESLYLRNARDCEFAIHVPGTPHIDESILAVPLGRGVPSAGAVVVSKLGVDQFDEGDLLVLETIASHASVALENARLFEGEKQAGEVARALFGLSSA